MKFCVTVFGCPGLYLFIMEFQGGSVGKSFPLFFLGVLNKRMKKMVSNQSSPCGLPALFDNGETLQNLGFALRQYLIF